MLHSELHTKLHSPTSYDHMIIDHIDQLNKRSVLLKIMLDLYYIFIVY